MHHGPDDDALSLLPLPLNSLGIQISVSPDDLSQAAGEELGTFTSWGVANDTIRRSEFSVLSLGDLSIVSGRTSPVVCLHPASEQITVKLCHAGVAEYTHGSTTIAANANQILLFPHHGGCIRYLHLAGICFQIAKARLRQTSLAMGLDLSFAAMDRPLLSGSDHAGPARGKAGSLFAFFRFLDALLAIDPQLDAAMGLEEQLIRLVALQYQEQSASAGTIARREPLTPGPWPAALNTLVAYIEAHPHQNLTLTDLQAISNYSARHLQNLFRNRFDCTPMQFVRRQRLSAAMARLKAPEPGDTVTRIARICGYRHTANFSVDFQRQFGVRPSLILRAAGSAPDMPGEQADTPQSGDG